MTRRRASRAWASGTVSKKAQHRHRSGGTCGWAARRSGKSRPQPGHTKRARAAAGPALSGRAEGGRRGGQGKGYDLGSAARCYAGRCNKRKL